MNEQFSDFDLDRTLLQGVADAGFGAPTPVQALVIPRALAGADLMVRAATGSGKTAAYLLPMLQRLLSTPGRGLRALVLVPTRELARQIRAELALIGAAAGVPAAVITGGEDRGRQAAALRRGPAVLIATPGRLSEFVATGDADLAGVQVLVLDEADRMLDLGLGPEVLALVARCGPDRQSLLFSATLRGGAVQRDLRRLQGEAGQAPPPGREEGGPWRVATSLETVAASLLRNPELIEADALRAQHPDIDHQVLLSDGPDLKQAQLLWLLAHEPAGKALVFVNARERAVALANFLIGRGQRAAALHGELDQSERKRVMGLFQRDEVPVLVATDLAARGLDLPGVGLVVNFDPPRNGGDYLHRTGRTGRAGERGTALTLVAPSEWNRVESIVRYLRLTVERRVIEGLEARFQGPSARRRPKRPESAKAPASKSDVPRVKNRLRDRKSIGKRRKPSGAGDDGPGTTGGSRPVGG